MEIERTVAPDGRIALWSYEWDLRTQPAHKKNRVLIGYEQPLQTPQQQAVVQKAICWSYGRTLGNIAVSNPNLLGRFPASEGDNANIDCDIVAAGKMRNGNERWWCRTHQKHWGVKADIAAATSSGAMRCSNHNQPMSYVVNPYQLNVQGYAEVGIWCSMPPGLTNMGPIQARRPRIHVHVRPVAGGAKSIDQDFKALSLHYNANTNLFGSMQITEVHLTPPAALEFVLALEHNQPMGCINCRDCGYPHLDLGDFARTPHTKHLCGNCGRDNTWSKAAIASTPLMPLHEQFSRANQYIDVAKEINLDDYPDLFFQVWASTPAVLWTAARPQERGIHVHIYKDGQYLIDDTFGIVRHQGRVLSRAELLAHMTDKTIN